jgi:4-hydroxy-3-methylbut-2-enyl diphosphate reductase
MTEIITAESCGFCFGVRKAVDMLLSEIELSKKNNAQIYLFGKIIHNDTFIGELKSNGVIIVDDANADDSLESLNFEENATVVIRAHGIPKSAFENLQQIKNSKNLKIADATCECVKRMHAIASENTDSETLTLIFGDKNHPEIVGLRSYVNGNVSVYKNFDELADGFAGIKQELIQKKYKKLIILVQTTHNIEDYKKCKDYIIVETSEPEMKNSGGAETLFFDTICGATQKRQAEAEKLSKTSDIMIAVGGQNSSNTKKLYEICKKNCANSFIVETAEHLPLNIFENLFKNLKKDKNTLRVSITAGASTPDGIIMEVKKIMTDNIINGENTENVGEIEMSENIEERGIGSANAVNVSNEKNDDEKSFEELLNESYAKTPTRGDRATGIVSYVSDSEIHVDLPGKYTGFLAFDEVTDDSSADLKEMFKVGDAIETQIIKTNDQEGTALLSKKRIDSTENWDNLIRFYKEGTVIDGKVVQVVNGGVIVLLDSTKVFVPASHADVSKDTDLNTLINKKVKVKIIDVNTEKRKAIASIRNASADARKATEEKIWSGIELNRKYEGTVKSIANYGVFVDIGGIDGMIHITELSWSRIKHPSEVLGIGDRIQVYIKDFDAEKRRISLGYRDENENPWIKFTAETKVGDVVDAKILNMMPFGAFAEVVPGVDGLIHISQIVNKKISKPSEILNVGDVVQVKITEINAEAKKISLSMRALIEPEPEPEPDPEEDVEEVEAEAAPVSEPVTEVAEVSSEETVEEAVEKPKKARKPKKSKEPADSETTEPVPADDDADSE